MAPPSSSGSSKVMMDGVVVAERGAFSGHHDTHHDTGPKEEEEEEDQQLAFGRKVATMVERANKIALERGHRRIGTGDILWALIEDDDPSGSVALRYLEQRGISREYLTSQGQFSDNAAHILKVASQKASSEGKTLIGTEDLLWAMFASSHERSRSRAVEKLEERGVSMQMVFGEARLSENAKNAFREAILYAKKRKQPLVGTEDLLWALFQKTKSDSRARNWLTSQHVDITSAIALSQKKRRIMEEGAAYEDEQLLPEFTVPRLFVVGGLAGTIETLLQQPFVYWKTMAQVDASFSIFSALAKPSLLFRGTLINAASIGPISAVQLAAHGGLEAFTRNYASREFTERFSSQMGMAALAGVFSCLVVTPAEVVMVTQQRTGLSLGVCAGQLWRTLGITGFFNGNVPTMLREAAWTCGFFGATPYLKKALQEDSKYFRRNEIAAAACASVVAGQAAATISQPADVVASLMKDDTGLLRPRHYKGVIDASMQLYKTAGVAGFFRGLASRSLRCCGAVFILGETQTQLHALFDSGDVLVSK